jgi:hypothetical protein
MQRQDGGKFSRKSERALLRIPIRIAGKDSLGNAFDEMTFTLLVNRTGGLITTSHLLVAGSTITITNPSNKISCLFRVISRAPKSLSGSPEWGVECLEPEAEIWGVSFPTRPEETAPADLIHVLLECPDCSAREMVALTLAQYRKLLAKSSMPRPCPKCHATRDWKFGFIEVELERVAPGPAAPSALGASTPGGSEKRTDRRLVVKLPLGIRLPDGRGETSKTENISESGLCFACSLDMQVGDLVYVTVGVDTPGAQHDTPGRIAWRRPDQEKGMTFYGIKLEKNA